MILTKTTQIAHILCFQEILMILMSDFKIDFIMLGSSHDVKLIFNILDIIHYLGNFLLDIS